MKDWKYAIKLENLLQFLADEYDDMTLDDAYEEIGFPIIKYFNENYQEIVEELKENGHELLDNLTDVPEEVKEKFLEITDENVEISVVKITGKLKLRYIQGNGVELIKETLKEAQNVLENPKKTRKLEISYIAAPFYRVEVTSKDYLDAENILSDAFEVIEQKVDQYDGTYNFERK
jgi:translation initiation factor 2 subunit 1